jgi:hypothetical protein
VKRDHAAFAAALLLPYALPAAAALLSPGMWSRTCVGGLIAAAVVVDVHWPDGPGRYLGKARFGGPVLVAVAELAGLIMLVRAYGLSASVVVLAAGLVVLHLVRLVVSSLSYKITQQRTTPILTRNIDLSALRVPEAPSEWLTEIAPGVLTRIGVVPVVVALQDGPGLFLLAVCLIAGTVAVAGLLRHVRANRHLDPGRTLQELKRRLDVIRPEVILYGVGTPASTYQVNMWLEVAERLEQRTLVVVRNRGMFRELADTGLSVLCVPDSDDLMSLPLDTVKVQLFTCNSGPNIHLLRLPGRKNVFIGHGDSDKEASFNPFSRVYDQIWVAGPAGAERYHRAGMTPDLIEVGRPQLAGVGFRQPGPVRTVLYAPTWEGWGGQVQHTSLTGLGPRIVRELIAAGVRVIYRPHPLTGTADPRVAAAHREVVGLLTEAGPGHQSIALRRDTEDDSPQPALYECFNQADLLIADISSVVADFLASQKPYVVCNVTGLPDAEFQERNPTASAAFILAEHTKIGDLLERAGGDELATERARLRVHLLGPDEPDAMTRFQDAVTTLAATASAVIAPTALAGPAVPEPIR